MADAAAKVRVLGSRDAQNEQWSYNTGVGCEFLGSKKILSHFAVLLGHHQTRDRHAAR